ncbi:MULTISPECIES: response regulator transcription factor [unclassified Arthrobacter]|uniref:response regulator transcription factor n=1 Tax=unclassified Arthrobacter TaxID=235627 RepID=UPI00159D997D|nr:response regulator transcription factor [Arthrobacter sp. STN4]MCQ9164903.1 response regulator transcription factor [Arthrobacter sp. STN4]NVM98200.1 response regulator transcription factor [Arthrobacter sp. SDTb3-6]
MDLLIVEDDDAVASALLAAVGSAGHQAARVFRGSDALLRHHGADMVLLDLGLPDMDGLDVLRKLRQVTLAPVIILTARDDERSVVRGLRLGADDYLVKPVKLAELLARIEAVGRRMGRAAPQSSQLTAGALTLNSDHRTAELDGRLLALTPTEFGLLELLVRHGGSIATREQIMDALWGDAFVAASRSLDVHLTGLRAKLGRPGYIVNVRGVGYRFEANPG